MAKEINVMFWLDDATEKKLNDLCRVYCDVMGEITPEQLFQNVMLTGSLIDANKKLDATKGMLDTARKKKCLEEKDFDEEFFVYENGSIYDRDTGELVSSYQ